MFFIDFREKETAMWERSIDQLSRTTPEWTLPDNGTHSLGTRPHRE